MLNAQGIFKYFSEEELVLIRSELRKTAGTWSCLVFADDVLLDNFKVKQHYERKRNNFQGRGSSVRRKIKFVSLPFDLQNILSEPNVFWNFRRLLFYTRVQFEISFDSGRWTPDEHGLYARSAELRSGLADLSNLHNTAVEALNQFKGGRSDRARDLMHSAFEIQKKVVNIHHHRQILDIFAILLLFHRGEYGVLGKIMMENFLRLARELLLENDTRRVMLESLKDLVLDSTGHQYLALDVYCRHICMSRMGHDQVKAYYSYNQASFPRADVGAFYDLFSGKPLEQINDILQRFSRELGTYSHETICLWHTAIRSLDREGRYEDMSAISQRICARLRQLGEEFYYQRQLNLDASLSFYLLGKSLDAQGNLVAAGINYIECLKLRDIVIADAKWDSVKVAALRKLKSISKRLGHDSRAELWGNMLNDSYSIVRA